MPKNTKKKKGLNSFLNLNEKKGKVKKSNKVKSDSNLNQNNNISNEKRQRPRSLDETPPNVQKIDNYNNNITSNFNAINLDDTQFNYPYLLLSSFYNAETNKTSLILYDEVEKNIHFFDDPTNHSPYFIVKLSKDSALSTLESSPEYSNVKSYIKEISSIAIIDRLFLKKIECAKIYTISPREVPKIRKIFEEQGHRTFESDIRYHLNYLFDNNLIPGMHYALSKGSITHSVDQSGIINKIPENKREEEILENFKKNKRYSGLINDFLPLFTENIPELLLTSFDIEVRAPENVFPKPADAQYPISCIASSNTEGRQLVFFLTDNSFETKEELIHDDLSKNTELLIFKTEKELLLSFNKYLSSISILVTFNGNNFDIPYLINRFKKLKIKNSYLSYDNRFKVGTFNNGIHLDLYSWFSNPAIRLYAYSGVYKDLKLNTLAETLLNKTKYDYDGSIWNLSGKDLIYYNSIDSQLTLELLTYDQFSNLKLMILLSRITHVPLDELTSKKVSTWLQYFFQFEHRKRSFLIPNSYEIKQFKGSQATSQAIIKDKKFQGAIVIEPKKGIHFDVTVLDFASLYPSIISSRNLSYETILCGHPECYENKIPGTQYYTCTLETGIISQLIGFLKDIRVDWFKKLSKSNTLHPNAAFYIIIEKSLKVLINAAYGVLGAEFFSFYCLPVAEATTAVGRHLIEKTIEKCEELEVEVLYGDTDSVFLKTPPKDVISEILTWSENKLGIPLEVDKEYKFIALTERKKNYLGVMKSGDLDIKGLLGKKSNIPNCIQNAFKESTEIISHIQSPEDFDKSREKIKLVISKVYERLDKSKTVGKNKGAYNPEDLAFSIQLTKYTHQYEANVQHVRAARSYEDYMRKKGNEGFRLQPGYIIKYIKGKNDVVHLDLIKKGFKVDISAYKSQMESTFSQILDSLGINIETLQNKVNLMDFL